MFAPAHALTLYFVVLLYGNSAAQAEHAAGEPHYLLSIFFIIVVDAVFVTAQRLLIG